MSPRVSPVSFLKLSADVASFYGFKSLREIEKEIGRSQRVPRAASSFATATHLCAVRSSLRPQEPVLAFYATPAPSHPPAGMRAALPAGRQGEVGEFGLCAVGSNDLGEILVLKTISAIATEWGAPVARIRLNALGDRDSKERFTREMGAHVRRRAPEFDETCRETLERNPLAAACTHEQCRAVLSEGPRSVNYLSEKSRTHFRQMLEQIEGLGLPYEIDDSLLGDERGAQVMFSLDLQAPDATVIASMGGRFDDYMRRQLNRKDGSAVSASIYFRKKGAGRSSFAVASPTRAPKVFFVQLGSRAKLQGLTVLDTLRKARLPVSQSFDTSKLSPQLNAAGTTGASYLIIMGQREALDGTVIVRTLKNGSQTIVELNSLPRFLKTLRV
jgi:histidyl-tRNA synthetase